MNRKVFVAIMDREVIGRQVVPNVARVVKVARAIMTRDRARKARKASQAKAKVMMAKEKAKVASGKARKAYDGYCNHCWKWGHMERIVSPNPRARVAKAKVQAVLMNLRKTDQRTLQLADSVCAHFETIVMTGSGTIVAK